MKSKRRFLWLIVLVAAYGAWAVMPVSAHAVLLRSNPPANAVLDQPPIQVELFFTETLEPKLSSISVIDSNSQVVDVGDVRVDSANATRMTVSLRVLPNGIYTVVWKALSTIDGHQTTGSFPFAVGRANTEAVQSLTQRSTARLPFTALIAKFLLLASLALLVGRQLFVTLIWDPVVRENAFGQPASWNFLYRLGLVGVMVSIGLGILSQAGQVTGNELAAPWNSQSGQMLMETRLGLIWLVRLCLIMLAVLFFAGDESRRKWWLGFLTNLGLLLTVTLTSHAATEPKPLLPILADWLHLLGMTFWFGGIAYFAIALRQLRSQPDSAFSGLTSRLAARFSANALIFVSLIGVTGIYSAYLRVGTLPALLTSLYGHTLLVKQLFVAGLLLIAGVNLLVVTPRLRHALEQRASAMGLVTRFARSLTAEIVLAVLLLGSVSFLTYIPPARAISLTNDLTDRARVDDLRMNISISPGGVGQNTFALQLTSDGKAVNTAKEVLLRFTQADSTSPPSELQLIGEGNGTFSAQGVNLSLPGRWQVQVVVRRADKFDAYANFDFEIRATGAVESGVRIPHYAGFLLTVIGLLCGIFSVMSRTLQPALRFGVGFPLAMVALVLGVTFLTRPVISNSGQANPIPPNQDSVKQGQEIYLSECAPCHGPSGKGDGPVGVALNPRPADLSQHAIPGVHPDAQLFEWITNGFPGSQMPPFKDQLSDTDRWHLVNFIRTLAPK